MHTIKIGNKTFRVELADTIFSRFRGLSGREDMGSYDGMLFIFPWRARWRMCMRGMKFPLDLVWIDGDKIVEVTPNLQPNSAIIKPSKRVDKILEVPAGSLASHAKEQLLARVEA